MRSVRWVVCRLCGLSGQCISWSVSYVVCTVRPVRRVVCDEGSMCRVACSLDGLCFALPVHCVVLRWVVCRTVWIAIKDLGVSWSGGRVACSLCGLGDQWSMRFVVWWSCGLHCAVCSSCCLRSGVHAPYGLCAVWPVRWVVC